MKLGFVSAIVPEFTLDQVFSFAHQAGFSGVELICWPPGRSERRYAGVTHIDASSLSMDAIEKIQGLQAIHQVAISGLGYYPNPLAADQADAEGFVSHLRKVIDAAAALGIGLVNTFVGRDPSLSVDANWPRFLEVWQPLIAHAEGKAIKIGIENCPMLFTKDEWPGGKNLFTSPAIWRRGFEQFAGYELGLNFDPSHFVWQQMDYLAAIREFAPRFWHCHAKDARLDRERLNQAGILAAPLEYHTPKLPGLGEVNWGQFFSVLADSGYNGAVCVEVEDRAYEGSLEARKAALIQSQRYLSQFVQSY